MRRFLRRLFVFVLCVVWPLLASAGMGISPGTPPHTHNDASTGGSSLSGTTCTSCTLSGGVTIGGAVALDNTLSSTKACASGYTRLGPNLCWTSNAISASSSLAGGTCTTLTKPDAGAKALIMYVELLARTANTAGVLRFTRVDSYNDASCVTVLNTLRASAYEFNATASNTVINELDATILVPSTTAPRIKMSNDVGANGAANYFTLGYLD